MGTMTVYVDGELITTVADLAPRKHEGKARVYIGDNHYVPANVLVAGLCYNAI